MRFKNLDQSLISIRIALAFQHEAKPTLLHETHKDFTTL